LLGEQGCHALSGVGKFEAVVGVHGGQVVMV